MGYVLSRGLTFVVLDGRAIFLDVENDRYFCMSRSCTEILQHISSSKADEIARQEVTFFLDAKILQVVPGQTSIQPYDSDESPPCTVTDRTGPRPSLVSVGSAIYRLAIARRVLRRVPLQDLIAGFKGTGDELTVAPYETLYRISRSFAIADLWLTPNKNCLSRSIAMKTALIRLGYKCELVIGVSINPFRAHSWVQAGDFLLNDRPDRISQFAPVLAV